MALPAIHQSQDLADVGVFGGSGFYSLLEGQTQTVSLQTPYGPPSEAITVGTIGGARVAFLPRHGAHHRLPPHRINYRANVWAMASLGVTRILAPNAAGSLQPHVKPGELVVCDQLVDRTYGREQTFYDGPRVVHVSLAHPYCPDLRAAAIDAARHQGIALHERGTVVVIQGPRFSTVAESRWFAGQGWEVINMTQYPEAALAREMEVCYVNLSLITDYDSGLEGQPQIEPVSVDEVIQVMSQNNERVRTLIQALAPRVAASDRRCPCATALATAVVS